MAKIAGRNSGVYVRHYAISGDGNRVNFASNTDTFETTGFMETAKTLVEGKYGWTIGIDGFWNSAANQSDQAIRELIGLGTQVVSAFLAGTTPAMLGYQGYGILSSYAPEAQVNGAVVFSSTITGSDKLYRTNITNSGSGTGVFTGTYLNLGTVTPGGTMFFSGLALPSSRGTMTVSYYASTSPVGATLVGQVASFTMIGTGTRINNIGTAINVGPYWRGDVSVPTTDNFTFITTGATNY